MDYYQLFQLPSSCSDKDVRKRYHELCIHFHPDKNQDISPEKFIQLTEAYEVLSDPIQRRHYDIQRNMPFLQAVDMTEEDYQILEQYYSRLTNSNEFKLMKLLYQSLPRQVIDKLKKKFTENPDTSESIYYSPKWIYIQDMTESQTLHIYVSMEDSYQNNSKRIYIKTRFGIVYLFLRNFHRIIHINNGDCNLTIHLHTKNCHNCYRKDNDLYYIVPASNKYNIIHLPNQTHLMTTSLTLRNLGFYNGYERGKLILVKLIP